jgi:enoyl-CoA hydratase/carnithine racemase
MAEVRVQRNDGVGSVVFSNPEKYNALNYEMWQAIPRALQELADDPQVRVIVLEGEGEKAFVSGADISQFGTQRTEPGARDRFSEAVEAAYLAPVRCPKPVIAKIRGICMGGGLGLAAACDLRICSTDARFRMPAARLGLGYGATGVQRFLSILGVQHTYDIFFSARIFGADDALRMGFVLQAVTPEALDQTVSDYVRNLAGNAPLTLKALKTTVNALLPDPGTRDLGAAHAAIKACFESADYKEGAQAFMEKRPPRFTGA